MKLFLLLPFFALFIGCVATKPGRVEGRSSCTSSLLKTNLSVNQLNAIISDGKKSKFERGQAVCTLFANYIKPGMDSKTVQKVLRKAKWLNESEVSAQYALAGWIPLNWEPDEDAGIIAPFSDGERRSWVLWIGLTQTGFVRKETIPQNERIDRGFPVYRELGTAELDLIAFLTGRWKIKGQPSIKEFAISYPEGFLAEGSSYDEQFTEKSLIKYENGQSQEK
jgi:hypothetical protein